MDSLLWMLTHLHRCSNNSMEHRRLCSRRSSIKHRPSSMQHHLCNSSRWVHHSWHRRTTLCLKEDNRCSKANNRCTHHRWQRRSINSMKEILTRWHVKTVDTQEWLALRVTSAVLLQSGSCASSSLASSRSASLPSMIGFIIVRRKVAKSRRLAAWVATNADWIPSSDLPNLRSHQKS